MAEIILDDPDWGSAVFMLFIVLIVLGIIAIAAARRPVLFKMGMKNAARRPSQTSLVLIGLMVGTAILSGAMISGDTMEFAIVKDVYASTDLIDELVEVSGGQTFNYSVYEAISADPDVAKHTDGISPIMLISGVTTIDGLSGQTEPDVILSGIDPTIDRSFGRFKTTDGKNIDGSDLGINETIINERLADALLAKIGHEIEIYFMPPVPAMAPQGTNQTQNGTPPAPSIYTAMLKVVHIVKSEGKATYNNAKMSFVTLETAQGLFNAPGKINGIKVSNDGGVVDGVIGTKKTTDAIQSVVDGLGPEAGAMPQQFIITSIKEAAVDIAESSSASFSDFLVMVSSFTIAAGVMLIINIFVMLAEERKKELGISRAVGMRRSALVRGFLFEGAVYSIIAAFFGALIGILIAYGLIRGIFNSVGGSGMDVPFYFKNSSLLMAFSMGFLITIGTVCLASWRVSKLNIVRAIRSIDEPVTEKGTKKLVGIGATMLGFGILLSLIGYGAGGPGTLRLVGPNLGLFGIALIIRRWTKMEVAYTFAGLSVLLYSLYFLLYGEVNEDESMMALVTMGLLMVFGAVLALVSNSKAMVSGFGRLASFSPKAKAVVEPAIGYPLNKGFRTGMTISMFALVIFIVLLFSIFFSVFTPNLEEEGGGYDLWATASVPVADIYDIDFAGTPGHGGVDYTTLNSSVMTMDSLAQYGFWGNFYLNKTEVPTYGPPWKTLYGIDTNFSEHVGFKLSDRSKEYKNDREAWTAVANNDSLAIVDSTTAGTHVPIEVGSMVSLPSTAGGNTSKRYKVVGIADVLLFQGLFVEKTGLLEDFKQIRGNNLFLIKLKSGEKPEEVAKDLEADFSVIGMNVIVVEAMLEDLNAAMEEMFQLFELFMSLGLVVGIASLGVLAVRSVIERKQEIGIMRAIGYRKSMVMKTFLFEMLFVTSMGVLIGVLIGYLAGYGIWKSGMEDLGVAFTVPWHRILVIIAMTFIAAIICTIIPSYKASRTNPAEAVRWIG